jgi:hypothetical protein
MPACGDIYDELVDFFNGPGHGRECFRTESSMPSQFAEGGDDVVSRVADESGKALA